MVSDNIALARLCDDGNITTFTLRQCKMMAAMTTMTTATTVMAMGMFGCMLKCTVLSIELWVRQNPLY